MGHDDSMMTLFELLTSIPVGITQQATDKNANIVSTNISYISQRREPSQKRGTWVKKEKALSAWEKLHSEYGDNWIWTAVDPVHKLVLAFLVGDHEETEAVGLLKRLKALHYLNLNRKPKKTFRFLNIIFKK